MRPGVTRDRGQSSDGREAVGVAESSDVPARGGQELGAEDNAEAGHAQDNFGVAVPAKSLLDHRVGVADFGVEGHHLLGQPGHHRRRQLLPGYHGVLGFGRFDRRSCYGIGVAGLAFTQPGRQPGSPGVAQPIGGLIPGEQDQRGLASAVVKCAFQRGEVFQQLGAQAMIARVRSVTKSVRRLVRIRSSTAMSSSGRSGCRSRRIRA